jgi:molecular chaperone GrpE
MTEHRPAPLPSESARGHQVPGPDGPAAARDADPTPAEARDAGRPAATDDASADEIADLRARVAELEDQRRRALADFDNLRKRVARESVSQRADERASVAQQWLPVLDNLERALAHAADDPSAIVTGVQAVHDQALDLLAALGFPRRSDEGARFDPGRHEAVAALPSPDAPAGTVLEVVRPGYGTDEHLLRPAAVVVAKGD